MKINNTISVYVHIPFCIKKCGYCDFLSYPLGGLPEQYPSCQTAGGEGIPDIYFRRLLREIQEESLRYTERVASSVFIGGGTPSLLSAEQSSLLMETLYQSFKITKDAEITIEANPGTLAKEKITNYRNAGINRMSLGLQSSYDSELQCLGRIHKYEDFIQSYGLARDCGFQNINVDLMSGLPGQTLDHWEHTLRTVSELGPEHISAYGLIIEEGTPFYERYGTENAAGAAALPSEETERDMYHMTTAVLSEYGYKQYEISNYAREGYECRHNIGYWIRKNYVGLGLGAASMVDNVRWKNTSVMSEYLKSSATGDNSGEQGIKREVTVLSVREQMEEYMFLGLRMNRGVSESGFFASFGKSMKEIYGSWIDKMVDEKLLFRGEQIRLTKKGRDLANYVMAGFLE